MLYILHLALTAFGGAEVNSRERERESEESNKDREMDQQLGRDRDVRPSKTSSLI